MRTVHDPSLLVGELPSEHKLLQYTNVPQVRYGDSNKPAFAYPRSNLSKRGPRVNQVLKHIPENDKIEWIATQVRESCLFKRTTVHAVIVSARGLGGDRIPLKAYERREALGPHVRPPASFAAADIQDSSAGREEIEELVVHDGPVRVCRHDVQVTAYRRLRCVTSLHHR